MRILKYVHVNTATTTALETHACNLDSIIVNTASAGAITVYNGTVAQNQVVAVIDGSITHNKSYECYLNNGLTVVTAGTADVTILWE